MINLVLFQWSAFRMLLKKQGSFMSDWDQEHNKVEQFREELRQEVAERHRTSVERDKSQSNSLMDISNKMDESSKMAAKTYWLQIWTSVIVLLTFVITLFAYFGISPVLPTQKENAVQDNHNQGSRLEEHDSVGPP